MSRGDHVGRGIHGSHGRLGTGLHIRRAASAAATARRGSSGPTHSYGVFVQLEGFRSRHALGLQYSYEYSSFFSGSFVGGARSEMKQKSEGGSS